MTFRQNLLPISSWQRRYVINVPSLPVPNMRSASPQCQLTTFIVHEVMVAVQQVSHQMRHFAVPETQNQKRIISTQNKMTSFIATYSKSGRLYSRAVCFRCQHVPVFEILT